MSRATPRASIAIVWRSTQTSYASGRTSNQWRPSNPRGREKRKLTRWLATYFNAVANRTVAADGADAERVIEAHGRPGGAGPQGIAFRGEGIDQFADVGGRSR